MTISLAKQSPCLSKHTLCCNHGGRKNPIQAAALFLSVAVGLNSAAGLGCNTVWHKINSLLTPLWLDLMGMQHFLLLVMFDL